MPPLRRPQQWTSSENPSYHYWIYYLWANIRALNAFRAGRGQSTYAFRPHCGEAGPMSHLVTGFLLADGPDPNLTIAPPPLTLGRTGPMGGGGSPGPRATKGGDVSRGPPSAGRKGPRATVPGSAAADTLGNRWPAAPPSSPAGISHGINLRHSHPLQYLWYLAQVPLPPPGPMPRHQHPPPHPPPPIRSRSRCRR